MKKELIFLVVLLMLIPEISAAVYSSVQPTIYECGNITEENVVYTMNKSLFNGNVSPVSPNGCIDIQAQNITLDCNGSVIRNTSLVTAGIYSNKINTTIKNCNITLSAATGSYGIYLLKANNSYVNNCTLNGNNSGLQIGLLVYSTFNSIISNITANLNDYGLYIYDTRNNQISNITANSNNYGVYLRNSQNTTLTSITANSNLNGIWIYSSLNNTFNSITANLNDYGIYFYGGIRNKLSNITANSNIHGVHLNSVSKNNSISGLSANSNGYGVYSDYGLSLGNNVSSSYFTNNIFPWSEYVTVINNNNQLVHNLVTKIINSTFIDEVAERTYAKNTEIIMNFSIQYLNTTSTSNFNFTVSIYPNESYTAVKNSENLTINFTATKSGMYSLKLNVTLLDTNDTEIRSFIFLVGNISSDNKTFYMHEDVPTHGQALSGTADVGSMFSSPTTTEEIRWCGIWVQYQPDEIINQYFVIKNISIGWFYKTVAGVAYPRIQRYVTYDQYGNYNLTIPASSSYVFNQTKFTGLNITSDYAWRFYALSLKLESTGPYVNSNTSNQSYATFDYLYAGPKIIFFSVENQSNTRGVRILSSVFNDDAGKNTTLNFEGEGNFTIVLNLTDVNYTIKYDRQLCPQKNCTINSNSSGIINLTLSLGSFHTLEIYEFVDTIYPIFSNYWDNNATLISSGVGLFNVTVENTNGTVFLQINNTNYTATNISRNMYNVSVSFTSNGTYSYSWGSWGNGTNKNYNLSQVRSYFINETAASPAGSPNSPGSSGSSGIQTISKQIFSVSSEQVLGGYTQRLRKNDEIRFFYEKNHTLTLKKIYSDKAEVTIESKLIAINLSIGEEKNLFLDENKEWELYLKLNNLSMIYANISIKAIKTNLEIPSDEEIDFQNTKNEQNPLDSLISNKKYIIYLLGGCMGVIILIIAFIQIRLRKKKRGKGK